MTHFWSGPLRGTFFLEAFDFNAFVQCLLRHWTLPDATQLGGIPRLNRLLVAVMYLHEHEVFRKLFIVTRAQEHKAPDVGGRTTFSKRTFQILVGILLDLRFRPFVLCLTFEFADRKTLPSRVIAPLPEPPQVVAVNLQTRRQQECSFPSRNRFAPFPQLARAL